MKRRRSGKKIYLEDVEKYFDKKSREDRLDTALLFFSSSLSFGFSLIFALFGKLILISFLPALFLGFVMPIYVGYIRGSLILDLLEERVRGWIYLLFGTGLYVSITAASLTSSIDGHLGIFLRIVLVVTFPLFLGFYGGRLFQKFFELFGGTRNAKTDKHFRATVISSVFMVVFFGILSDLITEGNNPVLDIFLIFIVCFALWFEIKARR